MKDKTKTIERLKALILDPETNKNEREIAVRKLNELEPDRNALVEPQTQTETKTIQIKELTTAVTTVEEIPIELLMDQWSWASLQMGWFGKYFNLISAILLCILLPLFITSFFGWAFWAWLLFVVPWVAYRLLWLAFINAKDAHDLNEAAKKNNVDHSKILEIYNQEIEGRGFSLLPAVNDLDEHRRALLNYEKAIKSRNYIIVPFYKGHWLNPTKQRKL